MTDELDLRQRVAGVHAGIVRAAARAGRPPDALRVLLATKTQTPDVIRLCQDCFMDLGAARPALGENRSAEGVAKYLAPALEGSAWSMIGPIEAGQEDEVAEFASEVQSVDRLSLAVALDRRLQRVGRSVRILIQVRTSAESSRFGVPPDEVPALLQAVAGLSALTVAGFMTRATDTRDADEVRRCFRVLRNLQTHARQMGAVGPGLEVLSMGMSRDYEIAVEEGSTCLRLGEAVFGRRSFRPVGGWWAEAGV